MRNRKGQRLDIREALFRKADIRRGRTKNTMYTGYNRLKSRRLQLGFSQEQVALKAEISYRSFQNYEQEKRVPSVNMALRIANVLTSNCEYLWSTAEKDSQDKLKFPIRETKELDPFESLKYTRLKFRRLELGFSQKELAREAGIGYGSYQSYEQELVVPNVLVAVKIAKLLNSNCFYLWDENVYSF